MVNIAKISIFLCTSTMLFGLDSPSGQQSDSVGSYEVIICTGDCNFDGNDNVILKGHFVIFDEPVDQDTQERLWAEFETNYGIPKPTACFELAPPDRDSTRGKPLGNLGANRNGFTTWRKRRDSGAVEITLFRSIDALCRIAVKKTGELFRGKATNMFMGRTESYKVTARRIGKPDVMFCVP